MIRTTTAVDRLWELRRQLDPAYASGDFQTFGQLVNRIIEDQEHQVLLYFADDAEYRAELLARFTLPPALCEQIQAKDCAHYSQRIRDQQRAFENLVLAPNPNTLAGLIRQTSEQPEVLDYLLSADNLRQLPETALHKVAQAIVESKVLTTIGNLWHLRGNDTVKTSLPPKTHWDLAASHYSLGKKDGARIACQTVVFGGDPARIPNCLDRMYPGIGDLTKLTDWDSDQPNPIQDPATIALLKRWVPFRLLQEWRFDTKTIRAARKTTCETDPWDGKEHRIKECSFQAHNNILWGRRCMTPTQSSDSSISAIKTPEGIILVEPYGHQTITQECKQLLKETKQTIAIRVQLNSTQERCFEAALEDCKMVDDTEEAHAVGEKLIITSWINEDAWLSGEASRSQSALERVETLYRLLQESCPNTLALICTEAGAHLALELRQKTQAKNFRQEVATWHRLLGKLPEALRPLLYPELTAFIL